MDPILGSIILFAGNFPPKGWAFCQGQIMSISQNTALFSLLGTTYGGNGTTTFALPDLRGRVPVQQGQGPGLPGVSLGQVSGSPTATLTVNNLPAHNHTAQVTINCAADGRPSSDTPVGSVLDSGAGQIYASAPDGSKMNANMATAQIGIAGGSQPFSTQSPYTGLNFIIALQGIYPSRN
jgi:microcystin-dependent protein